MLMATEKPAIAAASSATINDVKPGDRITCAGIEQGRSVIVVRLRDYPHDSRYVTLIYRHADARKSDLRTLPRDTPAVTRQSRQTEPKAPLKFGTRSWGEAGTYEGVVRRGRTVVWACGHHHRTRDTGPSARKCVEMRLRAVRLDSVARDVRSGLRANSAQAARLMATGRSDRDQYMARAEGAVAAFDKHVAELAALIGDEPVYGPGTSLIAARA